MPLIPENPLSQQFSAQDIDALLYGSLSSKARLEMMREMRAERVDLPFLLNLVEGMSESLNNAWELDDQAVSIATSRWLQPGQYDVYNTAAMVMAAGGVKVARFMEVSPLAPVESFNIIEQLGFFMHQGKRTIPERIWEIYEKTNLYLMFFEDHYPGLGAINSQWKDLQLRENLDLVFNYVLPLLNPVHPRFRVVGVKNTNMQRVLGDYMAEYTRVRRAVILSGENGVEINPSGRTRLYEVNDSRCHRKVLQTTCEGETCQLPEAMNARQMMVTFNRIVKGRDSSSVYWWQTCLSAGAGFYVARMVPSVSEGMLLAAQLLKEGEVARLVDKCRHIIAPVVETPLA